MGRCLSPELLPTGTYFNDFCRTIFLLFSSYNSLQIPELKFLEILLFLYHIQFVCATVMLLGETTVEKA